MRSRPYLLALVAACSFDGSGVPLGDAMFVDPGDDGGGIPTTLRFDTVEDFGGDGTVRTLAVVEPWGAIGPAAYLTGGLLLRASDDQLFASVAGDVWPTLEAANPDGLGLSEAAPVVWGLGRPRGIGIVGGDQFTVWLEGEILLTAGPQSFRLSADDLAFLDLAAPGGSFARVVDAAWPNPETGAYTAPVDGWYGIRVGFSEGVGDAVLDLEIQESGDTSPRAIPPERLRVRVDAVPGLSWTAWDDDGLLVPIGWFLFGEDGFDYSPGDPELAELGFADHDHLSFRWAGQLRIDIAGEYILRLDTDDGHRAWIDGEQVLDFFSDDSEDHSFERVLDVGWHDVVVDLTNFTGGQKVVLTVIGGPEGTNNPIEATRLRPVASRTERAIGAAVTGSQSIPDANELTADVKLSAPTGAAGIGAEVVVTIDHQAWSQLEIALISPDGSPYIALAPGASNLTGAHTVRYTLETPGEPVGGQWVVRVRDTAPGQTGTLQRYAVTARYTGGTPPIAPVATWRSPVMDLGDPAGLDAVAWDGRLVGEVVSVRVRTCDQAADCIDAPWSDGVTESGGKPSALARKFLQLEVELRSDGDETPSVDWVELSYRVSAR